jgi:diguanylate cyclase (GGDEF)-like protein
VTDWNEDTPTYVEMLDLHAPLPEQAYLLVLSGCAAGQMHRLANERTTIGRSPTADVVLPDDGLSRLHAAIERREADFVIRDLGSTNGTYCNGPPIVEHMLANGDKIRVGNSTLLKFTLADAMEESFQRQLYEAALRDALTNSFNRKYFLERLKSEFAFAIRHSAPLSLLLFDVDHFKRINDTHGHLAGDKMLAELAVVISGSIRHEDVLARYGGEEFGVICRGTALAGARTFAERVRRLVDMHTFSFNGVAIKVTVSVGVATVHERMRDAMELVVAADDLLYEAKRCGRNRVVCAAERTAVPFTGRR